MDDVFKDLNSYHCSRITVQYFDEVASLLDKDFIKTVAAKRYFRVYNFLSAYVFTVFSENENQEQDTETLKKYFESVHVRGRPNIEQLHIDSVEDILQKKILYFINSLSFDKTHIGYYTPNNRMYYLIDVISSKSENNDEFFKKLDGYIIDNIPVEDIILKLKTEYHHLIPCENAEEVYDEARDILDKRLSVEERKLVDSVMKIVKPFYLSPTIDYTSYMKVRKPSCKIYTKYAFYTSPNIVQRGTGTTIQKSFKPIQVDNVLLPHSHINRIHFICAVDTDLSSTDIDLKLVYQEEKFKNRVDYLNKDSDIIPTVKINTEAIKVAYILVGEEYLWLYAHCDTVENDKRFVNFTSVEKDIDPTKFYWAPTYLSHLHPVNSLMHVNAIESMTITIDDVEKDRRIRQWKDGITEEIRKGRDINPPTPKEILVNAVKVLGEECFTIRKL